MGFHQLQEQQLLLIQIDLSGQTFEQTDAVLLLTLNLLQLLSFDMCLACGFLCLTYLFLSLRVCVLEVLDAKLKTLNGLPSVRVG